MQDSELPKIKTQLNDPKINPREIKAGLAFEIAKTYHGDSEAKKAEEEFNRVFREKSQPSEMPEYKYDPSSGKIWIVKLLSSQGLATSNGEARRLIKQGAVSLNGERISDPDYELVPTNETIVKVGKRRFLRIVVQ